MFSRAKTLHGIFLVTALCVVVRLVWVLWFSDKVVVRSGGSIPVDGFVLEGSAAIDQSALTGESVPAEKTVGDSVSAATTVTHGYLVLEAQRVGEDTTLSQIIRLVEQAGGSKAPIARLADKVAGVFVPVVMTLAAIVFCLWLVLGEGCEFAMTCAIAVLVISCPCALGLATPVAIMVGTGRGARLGILFKNAAALEQLCRVDTVVLDKTGTLTVGKPVVTDILPAQQEQRLLTAAANRTVVICRAGIDYFCILGIAIWTFHKDILLNMLFFSLP